MSKRVAFIQNRLQFGGRFQVAVHMIKVLNELNIEPEFLCFATRFTVQEARDKYGEDINFRIRTIGTNYKVPFEWNILLFNKAVSNYLAGYDFVVNHNNTSFLYNSKTPTISYVHFPRKARLLAAEKSIHFPEGEKRGWFDIAHDALKLAHYYYKSDNEISPNNQQLANSEFTKKSLLEVYPNYNKSVEVLYPPVQLTKNEVDQKQKNLVVSLGRFSADKRQLEQIEIAANCSDLEFVLMGFINSQSYFKACEQRIAELNLKNVTLLADASKAQVQSVLLKARFFLHSLRNEPFGITAVEGVSAGCIPIVHDSGGQKEVVPNADLRYETVDQATANLIKLHTLSKDELDSIQKSLLENCKQFEATKFEARFKEIVKTYL